MVLAVVAVPALRAWAQADAAPTESTPISDRDVELFGRFVWLWAEPDGTNVVQYQGEFELHLGARRMRSQDAVIWITRGQYRGRSYQELTVFLHGDARVTEPAGTVTKSPTLVVTLRSSGRVVVNADASRREPHRESSLYRQADYARKATLDAPATGQVAGPPIADVTSPDAPPAEPGEPGEPAEATVRRRGGYSARHLTVDRYEDKPVVLTTGDVYVWYVWRTEAGADGFLELRADSAVLFLTEEAGQSFEDTLAPGQSTSATGVAGEPEVRESAGAVGSAAATLTGGTSTRFEDITGAYLHGDVVLTQGQRMIRASELYFDFENDRALILDPVMRVVEPNRNVPIYVRAAQARRLSSTEYEIHKAVVTTSEFHTPHYSVGAETVRLADETPPGAVGRMADTVAGTYEIEHARLQVGNVPLLYWPYVKGRFEAGEYPLTRMRIGHDSDFGSTVETRWNLFSLLGQVQPEGMDGSVLLDGYGKRGPASGVDLDYQGDDHFGLFRSYYVYDSGEDNLGGGRRIDFDDQDRGRMLLRHRHMLGDGWEATVEASYLSDRTFLEEWRESEFDQGKDQETLLYLKKQQDNWAFTTLMNWRMMGFQTQTEHLPEFGGYWLGESFGPVVLFSESRVGAVRYRPDERRWFAQFADPAAAETDVTARVDSRQELNVPIDLGPVRLVPFGSARGTWWDGTPAFGGARTRGFFSSGVRSSMMLSRVYENVESRILDLHRLRHEIKPDMAVWFSQSNVGPYELTPFDPGIEDLADFNGVTVGLRQRWQTKRGGPGRWRSVDWLTLDVELGLFDNADNGIDTHGEAFWSRPELSLARNFINANMIYRISDSTVVLYDANWDLNDGKLAVSNLSLAVERQPRLAYFLAWRMIGETDSNLLGFGANYKVTRKYTLALRSYFDIESGRTHDVNVTLIRKLPRLYVAMTWELDRIEDDWAVSLAFWPEGMPQMAIGSGRHTGLARSTGIKP